MWHAGEDRFVCTKQFDRKTKQLTDLPSSRGHPSSSEPAQPTDKVSRKMDLAHIVTHFKPRTSLHNSAVFVHPLRHNTSLILAKPNMIAQWCGSFAKVVRCYLDAPLLVLLLDRRASLGAHPKLIDKACCCRAKAKGLYLTRAKGLHLTRAKGLHQTRARLLQSARAKRLHRQSSLQQALLEGKPFAPCIPRPHFAPRLCLHPTPPRPTLPHSTPCRLHPASPDHIAQLLSCHTALTCLRVQLKHGATCYCWHKAAQWQPINRLLITQVMTAHALQSLQTFSCSSSCKSPKYHVMRCKHNELKQRKLTC